MRSLLGVLLLLLSTVTLAGCESRPKGRLETQPASGSVTIDGQPAEGVLLTFFGQDAGLKGRGVPVPMATSQADGTFAVGSYRGDDGAPVGTYKVAIVWPEPLPEGADPEFYERKDRLNGKFVDPRKSEFTVTIAAGTNRLDPIAVTTK